MDRQLLTVFPGILHHPQASHVSNLGEHIQLAQTVPARSVVGQGFEFIQVLKANAADVLDPEFEGILQ